ncbi:unnamed protein product [Anisakis simplex]|uniref:Uncharacterized protein n=1 Tax=Anisakis simplex TaxID=6269 RepID=A0A0M3JKY9_ANISI|nr:unnamed protein product [Anisakis simplex]VDK30749.1 unnamed protein product [Anisakis simplex]
MQRPGTKTAQSFHTTTTESQNRKVTSSVETKDDTDTTTTKITNEGDLLSDQTGQRARDLAATLCDVPSVDAKTSEKTQKDRKRSCSS